MTPGPAQGWDDLATWTGSVIEHDGSWHMLYTGVSTVERGLVQRIGLATSTDLVTWIEASWQPDPGRRRALVRGTATHLLA